MADATDNLPHLADQAPDYAPTDAESIGAPQGELTRGHSNKLAGNWVDDDGQAIDSYFEAGFHGPVASEYVDYQKENTPVATRVLTRSIDLSNYPVGQSVLLWPSDLKRTHLHIEANVSPVDAFIPTQATNNGSTFVLWSGTVSSRDSGITLNLNTITVDTAGFLNLEGSTNGTDWFNLANRPLTAVGNTNVNISAPLPPYIRITSTGGTGAGTVRAAISYDNGLEGYYWASEPISPISGVLTTVPIDVEAPHTGPVYVAKAFDNQTVINSWVVTE